MSESAGLARMLMALGVVFLIVGMLIPGEDAPWQAMVTSLGSQTFPTFDNPFDQDTFTVDMPIVADDDTVPPDSSTDNDGVDDCDTSANPGVGTDWWGCLIQKDDNGSYASVGAVETEFKVLLGGTTGIGGNLPVLLIRMEVQCRSQDQDNRADFLFYKADDTLLYEVPVNLFVCPESDEFVNVTFANHFDTPYPIIGDVQNGRMLFNPEEPIVGVDLSFVRISFVVGSTEDCSGADTLTYIGCQLGSFFGFLIKFGALIWNAAIFVGQAGFYVINIAGILGGGIFAILAFLFALPGAPVIVQGIVDIVLIGMISYVLLILLRLIRGGSGI